METCCDLPLYCTNRAAYIRFLKEIKQVRETRKNIYASNSDKTLRLGVSLPANLYNFLNSSMRRLYNEQLFTEEFNMFWFIKHFPQFQVPEKI